MFEKIVSDEGYLQFSVFNCAETGLFLKKMSKYTYITVEGKKLPGHRSMKDKPMLAIFANASGGFKVKPLLVYLSFLLILLAYIKHQYLILPLCVLLLVYLYTKCYIVRNKLSFGVVSYSWNELIHIILF